MNTQQGAAAWPIVINLEDCEWALATLRQLSPEAAPNLSAAELHSAMTAALASRAAPSSHLLE